MDHEEFIPETNERRRRHSAAFKAQVLAECEQPKVSVASVALKHGINQNMIYAWRRAAKLAPQETFLRLDSPLPQLSATPRVIKNVAETPATVRIDLPSPCGHITVHWPIDQLDRSAAWLKALMT
jgi:transposase